MTTISMDTNIYGMAVRGRTIYYCTKDKGIKMLNLSDLIWNNSTPPVLTKLTVLVLLQEITILPTGSKEHPVIHLPLVFIFCSRFSCIFWTDICCDRLATIIWACLSFFLTKFISQGCDSTTTSPRFLMQVAIVFRRLSILYDSLVWLWQIYQYVK
jgi:hypothetical protein